MPRPQDRRDFESMRMKIRRGTLAQTRRVRPGEEGPAEPDEIFELDAVTDVKPQPGEDPGFGEERWHLPNGGVAE